MNTSMHSASALLLTEQWLTILSNLGRASATIKAYRSALTHFFAFCEIHDIAPERASFEDIAGYIRPQLPDMPSSVASATLQLRLSALRLWYDFLVYQDICSLNPLPRSGLPGAIYTGRGLIPRINRLPVIPDDGEWLRFLKHVSAAPLRDRLMLALAYYGALRRTEVTALRLEDIDLAHRLIRIRAETTKNRRERMVCYSADVAPVLANHFQQLRLEGWSGGALFRSVSDRNYGAPLSFWSWSKTVRKWAAETDQPDITTHTFRHLRLTHLARAGWKLHELATYAGHRDPRTTQIYIHLSGTDMAARMAAAVAETDRKIAGLIFQAGAV
ncbi:site-specific integrase [Pantoea eucrina]|nr:site-specific integrase [Pantoea eucrina]UBB12048.1 site-specific integrase [Pantoea eucrina]